MMTMSQDPSLNILQGKLDFPRTMEDLEKELQRYNHLYFSSNLLIILSSQGDSVPHYGRDHIKLSHFHAALYEALTISPIALFVSVSLHNNPFSKAVLLKVCINLSFLSMSPYLWPHRLGKSSVLLSLLCL